MKSKKRLRHFHCYDALWEAFEGLANAHDRSVDSLLNEVMERYLSEPASSDPVSGEAAGHATVPRVPEEVAAAVRQAAGRERTATLESLREAGVDPRPAHREQGIFIFVGDERHVVSSNRFIIGRAKNADLVLEDDDVSRVHAAVVRGPGGYAIVDLGSTNGIFLGEERVENHRISEGDRITIGIFDLVFSFLGSGVQESQK